MLHLLPDPYKKIYLFQMILLITFAIVGIAVFPVVLLAYLILFKCHHLLCKAVINGLCYFLYIHFTYIAVWWNNLRMKIYADEASINKIGKEHALVIMNHKYDIDWIVTWIITEKFGGLGGAQSIAKKSLKYLPIIGWIWNFNGTIFLNRDWTKDKQIIASSLKGFSESLPGFCHFLLIYPEGTRFTKSKLESSNEVARSKGMPELKHCLLPRTKGFVEIVKNLRSQVDVIYDLTVGFPDSVDPSVTTVDSNQPALTMKNILNAKVKDGAVNFERINMKELPGSDDDLALWLQNQFRKKDNLFDQYVKTGRFPGPYQVISPSRTNLILYCVTFMLIWIVVGSLLSYTLWISSWAVRALVMTIILTTFLVINSAMLITQAEKGSSYGMKGKSS